MLESLNSSVPDISLGAPNHPLPSANCTPHYRISAIGLAASTLEEIEERRQQLGRPGGKRFQPNVLRSSDEQTVAGLAAVVQAIDRAELGGCSFANWGLISAPRYLGKIGAAAALYKYATGGAWKVSPMVVPHHCLHAMSGTISQALDIKGPNFGAGGGPYAFVDGLLTACTLLDENKLPGLWLVLTQCHPEPLVDPAGNHKEPFQVYAIALGFTATADAAGLRLHVLDAGANVPQQPSADVEQFFELFHFLDRGRQGGEFGRWSAALDWRARFVLSDIDYTPRG